MKPKTLLVVTDTLYPDRLRLVVGRLWYLNWRAGHPWELLMLHTDPSRDEAVRLAQINTVPVSTLYPGGSGSPVLMGIQMATTVQCLGDGTRFVQRLATKAGKSPKRWKDIQWSKPRLA